MSVGMGFVVLLLLPSTPEKSGWAFSEEEKQIAMRRTREAYNVAYAKIQPRQLIAVIRDPKAWFYGKKQSMLYWMGHNAHICCLAAFAYSCTNISLACFSSFLPIMIKLLDYSTLRTQLMTIPVYVVTGVFTIGICTFSDRIRKRGIFLIVSFLLAAVGWLILIVSESKHLSFAGTFLIGMGTYPTVVLIQTWMNTNIIGFTKRYDTRPYQ